jgi:hypothetical protein
VLAVILVVFVVYTHAREKRLRSTDADGVVTAS